MHDYVCVFVCGHVCRIMCVAIHMCRPCVCVCVFMLTILGREKEIHILGHIFAFSLHLGKEVLVVKNLACLFFLKFLFSKACSPPVVQGMMKKAPVAK